MGLLDAIPGLAAHQAETAEVVAEFDRQRAEVLIREAYSLVASMYPAGAMEWLRDSRPDVIRYLGECEAGVDTAVLAGTQAEFEKALGFWSTAHRKAFFLFLERPPVIERDTAVNVEAA